MHRSSDDLAFFAAALGPTIELEADVTGDQTSDDVGALEPGRYLVQLRATVDDITWITVGPFVKGDPITAHNDVPAFPLSRIGLMAVEFHVRKGLNDRVAARTAAGTSSVYITKVSYDA